ncbi:uncharacterized protein LOC136768467 [Amia ocellicauda]|uniref:uncharacterized protein LOC136768467 n=1 Tax=Amia ocellicauda TaxID=2972642 RepID=UPI003464DFFF
MSAEKAESAWRQALYNIIDELRREEYKKMLSLLDKIPQGVKDKALKQDLPQIILCHLGLENSIKTVQVIMAKIPRNDPRMLQLLEPFILKTSQKDNIAGKKRQRSKSRDENSKSEKKQAGSETRAKAKYQDENQDPCQEDATSTQGEASNHHGNWKQKELGKPPPKAQSSSSSCSISLSEVKLCGTQGNKATRALVLKKSDLISYTTTKKKQNFMFFVALADETDCAKVTVYGRECYNTFQENSSVLLHNLLIDGDQIKITMRTGVSKTSVFTIPAGIKEQALGLIGPPPPVCTIAKAKSSPPNTQVTIEGTMITDPLREIVKVKRKKTDICTVRLQDETGSVNVCLWRELSKTCMSKGDCVSVSHLRVTEYNSEISLSSTARTKVEKSCAPQQEKTLKLMGLQEFNKHQVTLMADSDATIQTITAPTDLLVTIFGAEMTEDNIVEQLPVSVHAVLQGNAIKSIKPLEE